MPRVWVLVMSEENVLCPLPHHKTQTHTQIRGLVRVDDTHLSDRQLLQLARNFLLGRPDPRKRRIIHGQPLQ